MTSLGTRALRSFSAFWLKYFVKQLPRLVLPVSCSVFIKKSSFSRMNLSISLPCSSVWLNLQSFPF